MIAAGDLAISTISVVTRRRLRGTEMSARSRFPNVAPGNSPPVHCAFVGPVSQCPQRQNHKRRTAGVGGHAPYHPCPATRRRRLYYARRRHRERSRPARPIRRIVGSGAGGRPRRFAACCGPGLTIRMAVADFNAAIAAAPDLAEAYVWRGIVTGDKGATRPARARTTTAPLRSTPDYWFAHGAVGLTLAEAGDDDAALAELAPRARAGPGPSGRVLRARNWQREIIQPNRKGPLPRPALATQRLSIAASDHLALYRVVRAQIFLERSDKEAAPRRKQGRRGWRRDSLLAQWNLVRTLATLAGARKPGSGRRPWARAPESTYPTGSKDKCPISRSCKAQTQHRGAPSFY